MVSAHNLPVERMAAARLHAACKALEVDRGGRRKAGPVIALVAIALLTIAPAMVKPIVHHAVFFMALRKPPSAWVSWGEVVESGGCVTPVTDVAAECPIVSRPQASFFRSVQNA
jgi:hypothetical protein